MYCAYLFQGGVIKYLNILSCFFFNSIKTDLLEVITCTLIIAVSS